MKHSRLCKNIVRNTMLGNNHGSSLIAVIVASSIGIIVLAALSGMFASQQKEIKRIIAKSTLLDSANAVRRAMSDKAICTHNFVTLNPVTIDNSSPTILASYRFPTNGTIPSVVNSTAGNTPVVVSAGPIPSVPGVSISEIKLINWRNVAPDSFMADISVELSSELGAMAPVVIQGLNVKTNTLSPANAKVLTECELGPAVSLGVLPATLGAPDFPQYVICNGGAQTLAFHIGYADTTANEVYYRLLALTGGSHWVTYHLAAPEVPGNLKSSGGSGGGCPATLQVDGRAIDGP